MPVLIDDVRKNLPAPKCKNGHMCSGLGGARGRRWGSCALCDRYTEAKKSCRICYYFLCGRCFQAYEDEQVKERSEPAGKHTFIRCEAASDITLHIPPPSVDPRDVSVAQLQENGDNHSAAPAPAQSAQDVCVAQLQGPAQTAGEAAGCSELIYLKVKSEVRVFGWNRPPPAHCSPRALTVRESACVGSAGCDQGRHARGHVCLAWPKLGGRHMPLDQPSAQLTAESADG